MLDTPFAGFTASMTKFSEEMRLSWRFGGFVSVHGPELTHPRETLEQVGRKSRTLDLARDYLLRMMDTVSILRVERDALGCTFP